ncbi:hypothetical protein KAFR_0E02370 [Kazachstania africana CBS 2517]|uniref:V-type proton ATPase subunit E n=1 Tax=Kazachstania africana (strain ATCC 22294 / BCRC 22015 / CBS 2517 / CECT 1963 / NBRC 1671 / NRRL Y-8276) TaxID=1071382 RepID=H2AVJ0_KAZAF|nr:hypothetical protein KAFR_0E02370 [Kazachstania africana CBS 2517]CCF58390.1 hypothetical protein KAFR_0E02370 [Kazachstania africana CBS 2517]
MSTNIITSLTPNQVNDELNKMQQFIKKEAEEKAREIRLKADQEYEIEKTNIVNNETNNIDVNYEARLKKISLKQQILKSTISNKIRLRILAQREACLEEIFDETKGNLKQLVSDEGKYKTVMSNLILESALKLLEPRIVVKLVQRDRDLVESLLDDVKEEYKKHFTKDLEIVISDDYLSESVFMGGVIVSDSKGKIELNNTLDERLNLLNHAALPAIRLEMFGISKTRKFFD